MCLKDILLAAEVGWCLSPSQEWRICSLGLEVPGDKPLSSGVYSVPTASDGVCLHEEVAVSGRDSGCDRRLVPSIEVAVDN